MDNVGRPVEGILADNQEIQRRYQTERVDDVNYVLGQKDLVSNDQIMNLDPNDKVAYIKGDKTICCWNCQSILMVKDEWSVVQCTNCEKVNKIPGTDDVNKQIRLNDNLNHFDIHLPYVYVIITCPFCRTENKARKDAEHVVCYKCHNSVSILHDNKPKRSNMLNNYPDMMNPPNKSQRSNELFFPQPNQYGNYNNNNNNFGNYPPYHPNPYNHNPYMPEPIDKQMEQYIQMEIMKKRFERKEQPRPEKFGALKDLINTVNHISENRFNKGTPGNVGGGNAGYAGSKYQNDFYGKKYSNGDRYVSPSPLKSGSVYKNIFPCKSTNMNYEPPDTYQNFKKRDRFDFDEPHYSMSPYTKKFY